MNKIILIGAGGHVRPIVSTFSLLDVNINFIIDLKSNFQNEKILGVKVFGLDKKKRELNNNNSFFLSIGDNNIRNNFYNKYFDDNSIFLNVIHPTAYVDKTASIGVGNYIGPFAHIGPLVKIGNHNIINTKSNIEHESEVSNFCHIAPNSTILGRCKVENRVLIGASSTILHEITISEGTIIGSNSFINKNFKEKDIKIFGSPGKKKN